MDTMDFVLFPRDIFRVLFGIRFYFLFKENPQNKSRITTTVKEIMMGDSPSRRRIATAPRKSDEECKQWSFSGLYDDEKYDPKVTRTLFDRSETFLPESNSEYKMETEGLDANESDKPIDVVYLDPEMSDTFQPLLGLISKVNSLAHSTFNGFLKTLNPIKLFKSALSVFTKPALMRVLYLIPETLLQLAVSIPMAILMLIDPQPHRSSRSSCSSAVPLKSYRRLLKKVNNDDDMDETQGVEPTQN